MDSTRRGDFSQGRKHCESGEIGQTHCQSGPSKRKESSKYLYQSAGQEGVECCCDLWKVLILKWHVEVWRGFRLNKAWANLRFGETLTRRARRANKGEGFGEVRGVKGRFTDTVCNWFKILMPSSGAFGNGGKIFEANGSAHVGTWYFAKKLMLLLRKEKGWKECSRKLF